MFTIRKITLCALLLLCAGGYYMTSPSVSDAAAPKQKTCTGCNGTGNSSFSCTHCKGNGKINNIQCAICKGSGKQRCATCKGTGSK